MQSKNVFLPLCLTSQRPNIFATVSDQIEINVFYTSSQKMAFLPWPLTSKRPQLFYHLGLVRDLIFLVVSNLIEIYVFYTSSERMGVLPWCLTSQRPHIFGIVSDQIEINVFFTSSQSSRESELAQLSLTQSDTARESLRQLKIAWVSPR